MNGRIMPFVCEPGRLLYAPGESAESLYLLARGRVHLYRLAPNGKKLVVAALRDGAFFGPFPPGHWAPTTPTPKRLANAPFTPWTAPAPSACCATGRKSPCASSVRWPGA